MSARGDRAATAADVRVDLLAESCREELESLERCGAPAEFILWGKLLPPESLGPRCYDCAAKHVGHRALGDRSYAIFHLKHVAHRGALVTEIVAALRSPEGKRAWNAADFVEERFGGGVS